MQYIIPTIISFGFDNKIFEDGVSSVTRVKLFATHHSVWELLLLHTFTTALVNLSLMIFGDKIFVNMKNKNPLLGLRKILATMQLQRSFKTENSFFSARKITQITKTWYWNHGLRQLRSPSFNEGVLFRVYYWPHLLP